MAIVERSSLVPAPAADVWTRAVTPEGIDDEFRPWLSMSIPAGAEGITIDTLELGKPIGRCWVKLFGILPVDYDDLTIVEIEPGRRFLEQSRLFSSPQWQHERTVDLVDARTSRLTDRLEFRPRFGFGLLGPRLIGLIFWNRHRRVQRYWSRA